MNRLRKLVRLPRAERRVLVQAWALFLVADLGLRCLPFKYFSALLRKMPLGGGEERADFRPLSMARLERLVEIAGRYAPVEATCLKRALVLSWLLRRRGITTTLQIGVVRQGEALAAHAWLEVEGRPILGVSDDERYERLFSQASNH